MEWTGKDFLRKCGKKLIEKENGMQVLDLDLRSRTEEIHKLYIDNF